jgi:hypothetical protein
VVSGTLFPVPSLPIVPVVCNVVVNVVVNNAVCDIDIVVEKAAVNVAVITS